MTGKLMSGSGYEVTMGQVESCTTGSVKGINSRRHCNKTWLVNECFAEAIDRLFCEKYGELGKPPEVQVDMTTETN